MLHEMGIVREVVRLAMLEDKEATLLQQVLAHDELRKFVQIGESVWRVGKDEVELLATTCHVLEHISADGYAILVAQFLQKAPYETMMKAILLDRHDLATTTREQLESDASGARKEVEGRRFVIEVEIPVEDIKEVLFGKIRRRSCLERARDVEMTSLVFTCYYAQSMFGIKVDSLTVGRMVY